MVEAKMRTESHRPDTMVLRCRTGESPELRVSNPSIIGPESGS
jgi:hypothetical protein